MASEYIFEEPWSFPVPEAPRLGVPSPLPDLLPATWRSLVDRAAGSRFPVSIVAVDEALNPKELAAALAQRLGARGVDLDGLLGEFGPGGRYHAHLSARAVLDAVRGLDPVARLGLEGARAGATQGARGSVVLWPCALAVERLLLHPDRVLWRDVAEALGAAFPRGKDRVVCVLPTRLASRLAWALRATRTVVPVARRPTDAGGASDLVAELVRWLVQQGVEEGLARQAVEAADLDVRALWESLSDPKVPFSLDRVSDAAVRWAWADAQSLSPQALLRGLHSTLKSAPWEAGKLGTQVRALDRLLADRQALLLLDGATRRALLAAFKEAGSLAALVAHLLPGQVLLDVIGIDALAGASDLELTVLVGPEADREILRAAGRAWQVNLPPQSMLEPLLRAVSDRDVFPIPRESDHETRTALLKAALPEACEGFGAGAEEGAEAFPTYLVFCPTSCPEPDFARLATLLRWTPRRKHYPSSLMVMMGPGVQRWTSRPDPRGTGMALLDNGSVRRILASPRPSHAFWGAVRAQTGLLGVSPFQTAGALQPGSPTFVGRHRVIQEIVAQVATRNHLILGSRQIGKTSLLNQVRNALLSQAQARSLSVFYLDCQGRQNRGALVGPLSRLVTGAVGEGRSSELIAATLKRRSRPRRHSGMEARAEDLLEVLVEGARAKGTVPIFLFNEIDGLVEHEIGFFRFLRGLSDTHCARFVMVGYANTALALTDPHGPFHHFTDVARGGKAYTLSVLEVPEARQLVDLLKADPLHLEWFDGAEEAEGVRLLLSHSGRVPWVLQSLCASLVSLLDREQRYVLRVDDVRSVVVAPEGENRLLEHLDETDFGRLAGQPHVPACRPFALLVLALLVRKIYRRGAVDEKVFSQDSRFYSFSVESARAEVRTAASQGLGGRSAAVLAYVADFPFQRFFDGLCLTLILSPSPREGGDPRWCFQEHIYPRVLWRADDGVRRLEDRISRHLLECDRLLTQNPR